MPSQPGPIRRLWFQWKTMQLPWRKQWLIGFDLQGNTYWEFKDALHSNRHRRIVKYPGGTHHGDVKVPPQWMQWLRHTRFEPPTIADQQAEVYRQDRMKVLAAQADARWAAKPSALDAPDKQQPVHMLDSGTRQTDVTMHHEEVRDKPREEQDAQASTEDAPTVKTRKRMRTEPKDSPWKQAAKGNPGDEWQPAAWSPPVRRGA